MLLQGEGIGRPEEEVRRRREGEGTAAKLIQCRTIGVDEQDSVAGGEGRGADEEEGGTAGTDCIKIALPGKLILGKRKGLCM